MLFSRQADAISARISSTRQAVTREPNFTGFGKRPDLTPAHQQDFLTGMIGGMGGLARGSPIICGKRRKPVWGSWFIASVLVQVSTDASSDFRCVYWLYSESQKPYKVLAPYFMRISRASGIFLIQRRTVSSLIGAPISSVYAAMFLAQPRFL